LGGDTWAGNRCRRSQVREGGGGSGCVWLRPACGCGCGRGCSVAVSGSVSVSSAVVRSVTVSYRARVRTPGAAGVYRIMHRSHQLRPCPASVSVSRSGLWRIAVCIIVTDPSPYCSHGQHPGHGQTVYCIAVMPRSRSGSGAAWCGTVRQLWSEIMHCSSRQVRIQSHGQTVA
jgi:hypothetical protein